MQLTRTKENDTVSGAVVNWACLLERVQRGDASADEELYRLFERGIRFYMLRQVGPDEVEDAVHDIFIAVIDAIRRRHLRDPERLIGFVRTVAYRRAVAHLHGCVDGREREMPLKAWRTARSCQSIPIRDESGCPEQAAADHERLEIMARVLRGMSPREREVLTRFYLQEQSRQQICAEMNLTDTQFRLLKSRAKARFGERGRGGFRGRSVVSKITAWIRL